MRRVAIGTLWFVLAGSSALVAGPLDGRWSLDAEFCKSDAATDAVPVVIDDKEIQYYESRCTMTGTKPIGSAGSAWRVATLCHGEGEEWQGDTIFALDRDSEGTPRQLVEIDMDTGDVVVRQSCD
jgi:hypothetical protein